jgi:hypothetical protein
MNKATQEIADIILANRSGEKFSSQEVMEIAIKCYELGRRNHSDEVMKIIEMNPLKF